MNVEKVATIQGIYQAFGKQDVAAILAHVTPETAWDFNGGRPEQVAWHRPIKGREQLPRFFEALGSSVEVSVFQPKEFIHCGPHVVVEVHIEYTVRATGRKVAMDQLQWWTLNEANQVTRLRHFEDTAQVLSAIK